MRALARCWAPFRDATASTLRAPALILPLRRLIPCRLGRWGRCRASSRAAAASGVMAAAGSVEGAANLRVTVAEGATGARRTMRILLVEDDMDLQRLLK